MVRLVILTLLGLGGMKLSKTGSGVPQLMSMLFRTQQEDYKIRTIFREDCRKHLPVMQHVKELGLVSETFPYRFPTATGTGVELPTNLVLPPYPLVLPFLPLEENVEQLQEWLRQHFSSTAFITERIPLPIIDSTAHHIYLTLDACPVARHTPALEH